MPRMTFLRVDVEVAPSWVVGQFDVAAGLRRHVGT